MDENNKTITTHLTHDIIKKDFFTLHVNYLKIVRNLGILLFCFITTILWLFELLPMENKTLAILFVFPFGLLFLLTISMLVQWLYGIFCILTKRYKVVTDYVQQRKDRYELKRSFQWYQYTYRIKTTLYSGYLLDELLFTKSRHFGLERHIYYKWSPMFELSDEQLFEQAQIGASYHLILVGKKIVMIYNTQNFLLEEE